MALYNTLEEANAVLSSANSTTDIINILKDINIDSSLVPNVLVGNAYKCR
ncbi:hypothetical protein [Sulfuricurvum sp. RIFCSPLOWO2_12_FULL_43_24]|nr:hypothetical protein [Sulfuricurvum sp. RIFCSPLOWO2_12_FULL_43_24]